MSKRAAKVAKPKRAVATQIKFRIDESLKAQLDHAANARGLSLNTEITERLVKSLQPPRYWDAITNAKVSAIVDLIAEVACSAGANAALLARLPQDGTTWADDPYSFDQVGKAVIAALNAIRPKGAITPPGSVSINKLYSTEYYNRTGTFIADSILFEVASANAVRRSDRTERLRASLGADILARIERNLLEGKHHG